LPEVEAVAQLLLNAARSSPLEPRGKEETMTRFASTLALSAWLVGCGGSALPPAKVADTQAAIAAAAAVGAESNPQAALHLKMARDQLRQAQWLLADGKDREARLVLERAQADADVAMMLTREAQAAANVRKAQAEIDALQSVSQ
jgi:hypothetical protein